MELETSRLFLIERTVEQVRLSKSRLPPRDRSSVRCSLTWKADDLCNTLLDVYILELLHSGASYNEHGASTVFNPTSGCRTSVQNTPQVSLIFC